mgnify:CR=1 FL=1|tara:strand:+ start:91 stop:318 length:228 start_codon:yes stop_codon:yes gene_type:complete
MRAQGNARSTDRFWFFFSELTDTLTSEDLLQQAYILVSKIGFSYSDVKMMTKKERMLFLKFYSDEMTKIQDSYEN